MPPECQYCQQDKGTTKISGREHYICLNFDCITDRMLEEYEGCNHNFETRAEYLLECSECGMGATPSYIRDDES